MFDVIIIGAGPAGISAALYTKRSNLKTLIMHYQETSLENAEKIDNYYGFENGITGKELYLAGIKQAQNLGIEIKEEEVIKIQPEENNFKIYTTNNEYTTKSVILATGNKKNKPNIQGITQFEGKGISYCAICDGFFYRNKTVAVIGSGNYAISEVNDLLNIANKITILTNGETVPEFRADNVEINSKPVKEIRGETRAEEIEFLDNTSLKVDGIFVAQGVASSSDFARKLGIILKKDQIVVNEKMETNIPGIYACGDCTGGTLQIAKAVYEGMKTGLNVIQYIKKK